MKRIASHTPQPSGVGLRERTTDECARRGLLLVLHHVLALRRCNPRLTCGVAGAAASAAAAAALAPVAAAAASPPTGGSVALVAELVASGITLPRYDTARRAAAASAPASPSDGARR